MSLCVTDTDNKSHRSLFLQELGVEAQRTAIGTLRNRNADRSRGGASREVGWGQEFEDNGPPHSEGLGSDHWSCQVPLLFPSNRGEHIDHFERLYSCSR